MYIVVRTGAQAAWHPFLGHPWCVSDSHRVLSSGVLTALSIADLLSLVRGQDVQEEIKCNAYRIGTMGECATRPRPDPEHPLPLRYLKYLNRDGDICTWFLANNSYDPLDFMILESRPERCRGPGLAPQPPNGMHSFFDRPV